MVSGLITLFLVGLPKAVHVLMLDYVDLLDALVLLVAVFSDVPQFLAAVALYFVFLFLVWKLELFW